MRSPYSVCRYILLLCLSISHITIDLELNTKIVQAQPVNKQTADCEYKAARETIASGSLFIAKPKLQNALRIYQSLNDRHGQYDCLIELARIDYKQADYRQAGIKQRRALQAVSYSSRDGKAKTLAGLIALELGDYNEALSHLKVGIHELQISGTSDRNRLN